MKKILRGLVLHGALGLALFSTTAHAQILGPPKLQGPVEYLYVSKSKRLLYVAGPNRRLIAKFRVALGFNPIGHKLEAEDGRTPEGKYYISAKNPNSDFYKSLRTDYPNRKDRASAAARKVDPGKDIMIHGIANEYAHLPELAQSLANRFDWTRGCIAITNGEMDQIYGLIKVNTPIYIVK
jgi:murein L,D-transpeptidase YafK